MVIARCVSTVTISQCVVTIRGIGTPALPARNDTNLITPATACFSYMRHIGDIEKDIPGVAFYLLIVMKFIPNVSKFLLLFVRYSFIMVMKNWQ